jgi:hypothetical protein
MCGEKRDRMAMLVGSAKATNAHCDIAGRYAARIVKLHSFATNFIIIFAKFVIRSCILNNFKK